VSIASVRHVLEEFPRFVGADHSDPMDDGFCSLALLAGGEPTAFSGFEFFGKPAKGPVTADLGYRRIQPSLF
jgi:hypothetical protein